MAFTEPLKDVSVPEKKQAKFECAITKEVSKVMWWRGTEVVTPGPKYEIIDDGKKHMLVINTCEFDDEAQYTIEVLGLTSAAQLTVEGKYWTSTSSFAGGSRCLNSFCHCFLLDVQARKQAGKSKNLVVRFN